MIDLADESDLMLCGRVLGYTMSLALIAFGIHAFWHAYAVDYSMPVEGRVLEAHEMVTWKIRGLYTPGLPFRYVFTYRYSVNGHDYRSGRYAALPYKRVREAVARYSPGDEIRVWVNPGRPSRSIVDRSVRGTDMASIVVGLLLGAVLRFPLRPARAARRPKPILTTVKTG